MRHPRRRWAVPFLALAWLVAGATRGFAEDLTILAERMVESLAVNDFQWSGTYFDETMKKHLTPDMLKGTWYGLLKQTGKLQSKRVDRIQKVADFDVVFVDCQFEKGRLETKVVFNAQKKIAGLFFLPVAAAAATTRPPDYARPDQFKETPIEVGTAPWNLPGLLTVPVGSGPFPGLVLVHGSGPNDRDETVGGCRPFRDLAWGLSSRGIAVLRYDKRTLAAKDQIIKNPVGFTVREETIVDAVAAVTRLASTPGIDPQRIWVLGHSLGGMLVPRLASAGARIAGFVILAGATRPLEDMIVEQMERRAFLTASPSGALLQEIAVIKRAAADIKGLQEDQKTASGPWILGGLPGYWLDLRGYKPHDVMKGVAKPALILQGERDYQVTMQDFANWKHALGNRKDVRFISYPLLNHLFVSGQGTSTAEEYQKPGHVAESVIKDIEEFIRQPPRPLDGR